jgi:hypothetical protein
LNTSPYRPAGGGSTDDFSILHSQTQEIKPATEYQLGGKVQSFRKDCFSLSRERREGPPILLMKSLLREKSEIIPANQVLQAVVAMN